MISTLKLDLKVIKIWKKRKLILIIMDLKLKLINPNEESITAFKIFKIFHQKKKNKFFK